jgi:predicted XRE-type DNA-binding protein
MTNEYIRKSLRINDIRQWQVAEVVGVSEGTLCRWMRRELSESQRAKVMSAITTIIDERKDGHDRFDSSLNLDILQTDCSWR